MVLLLLFTLLALSAKGAAGAGAPTLLVAAASDLVLAFREIAPAFERERGVKDAQLIREFIRAARAAERAQPGEESR